MPDGRLFMRALIKTIATQSDEGARQPKTIRDATLLKASFGELLNSMSDASFLVNSTGSFVLVNALTEKMFGYASHELQGKSVGTLIPERFRGVHAGHCSDYVARPRTRDMGVGLSLRALRKDGTDVPGKLASARSKLIGAPMFLARFATSVRVRNVTGRSSNK